MVPDHIKNSPGLKKIAWVLHVPYKNEGRVYKETQTLAEAGYEVTVFALWEPGLPVEEWENQVRIRRLAFPDSRIMKALAYAARIYMPLFTLKALIEIRRYRPDIIYCMNYWTLHIGKLCKIFYNIPYIYDSQELFTGQLHMNGLPEAVRRLYARSERFLARGAAAVIQTTDSRGREFARLYGLPYEVIMNKAAPPAGSGPDVLNAADSPALNTPKKKLVYVGSVTRGRGLEQIIEATSGMDDVRVYLLGSPYGFWGQSFMDKYKDRLSWLPPVDPGDVSQALTAFDLGLTLIQRACLSYYLSCPTKLWELIASGTPQLASDFPEMRKIILENGAGPVGRVVDPADVARIRRNIEEMLGNPDEMRTYRENCLKLRELCSWEHEGRKLVNLTESALSGNPDGRSFSRRRY